MKKSGPIEFHSSLGARLVLDARRAVAALDAGGFNTASKTCIVDSGTDSSRGVLKVTVEELRKPIH